MLTEEEFAALQFLCKVKCWEPASIYYLVKIATYDEYVAYTKSPVRTADVARLEMFAYAQGVTDKKPRHVEEYGKTISYRRYNEQV